MDSFSQSQAILAKYWYERLLFTAGPVALPTGLSTIFTAASWTPERAPDWQAALIGIAATQNADVQLQWVFDDRAGNQSAAQGWSDAGRAGVRRIALHAPSVRQLQLVANNLSGGVVAGYQLTYEVAMRRLSIADKLLHGYDLSPQDEQVLSLLDRTGDGGRMLSGRQQIEDLVERGTSPISMEFQLDRTLENRRLGDHTGGGMFHITASASTTGTPFATLQAGAGEFLVLREIAIEGAPAMTLYVDRDEDLSYLQLTGTAFVQSDDAPWDVFVPALRSISFRAGAGATLNDVPVRIRVERYRLSALWRVRLGLARSPQAVPGDTYAKVWAGIA